MPLIRAELQMTKYKPNKSFNMEFSIGSTQFKNFATVDSTLLGHIHSRANLPVQMADPIMNTSSIMKYYSTLIT